MNQHGGKPPNERDIVRSVVKAFHVLESFTDISTDRTVSEIARDVGLDRGIVYRMVVTLESLGYLERGRSEKTFRLALKCLDLGLNALAGLDIRAIGHPRLRDLVPDYGDAASLAVLDGAEVLYIDRIGGSLGRTGLFRRIGSRIPVYGAAIGFALLAHRPREQQIAILGRIERVKLSDRTVTDLNGILNLVDEAASRGYAVSDQQNAFGLRTIAAPILGSDRLPIAAVSVTVGSERMDMEAFEALSAAKLMDVATEVSRAIDAMVRVGLPPGPDEF